MPQGVALGLAAGAVVTIGVVAAIAFPTMRDLNPTLPGLEGLDDHWMLAAGMILTQGFNATSTIVGVCLAVASIAFVSEVFFAPRPRQKLALALRLITLLALLAVFAHNWGVVQPRMNTNFQNLFASARSGDFDAARTFRAAFDADHPAAGRELGAIAILSFAGAILSGFSVAKHH